MQLKPHMYLLKQMVKCSVVFAFALMLCVGMTSAQQQPSGSLRGQVTDQLGGLIAGATVTIVDEAGVEKTVATNGEGVFVITALALGKYTVRATAKGFGPYENTDVKISAGPRDTLNIKLEVTFKENVDVSSSNSGTLNVDPDNNNSGLVLKGADLNILADDPDQLVEDLRSLAGPAYGPNGTQFFVDGFSGGRLPPKTSIREVRINQNPFAAEQDTLGFGRVEIFTKPGTGKLHGQAYMFFNDESFNARNPLAPAKVPFQVRQFGGNLTGPLSKKASFFADIEKRDIDENTVISALILDPSLNPLSFGQAIVVPQRRTNFSGRLDYQLNQSNTLLARYGLLHSTLGNQGVGGFSLQSVALNNALTEQTLQLTDTAVVSPTVVNETRFQFVHSILSKRGDNSTPTINVQGAFTGGGAPIGDASSDTNRYELINSTTWAKGLHTIKFGGRLRGINITDVSGQNFNGQFIFSSLGQYQQVLRGVAGARPAQLIINGGNPQADVRRVDLGAFLQDDWRVKPNLTFSYGLRFEGQNNINDHTDFAPRISFAWAPKASGKGGTPKTVIRGGVGVFYFRFGEDLTLQATRFNGLNQQQLIITNPGFFPVIPSFETLSNSTPQTIRGVAADLQTPYAINEALSVERQLPLNTTIGVTYIHEDARHLLRSRNLNAPLPGTFIPGVPGSGVRPSGNTGNLFLFESSGKARSDGLYLNVRGMLSPKVSLFSIARLYHEKTDTDGPFDFPSNSFDTSADYGPGLDDTRATVFVGSNIILPWKVTMNAFLRATTGNRFNIITGRDTNGDAVFTERPALATDLSKPGVVVTSFGAFDPNPAPGQEIIPRNFGRGPGFFNVNVRFSKTFNFGSPDSSGSSSGAPAPRPGPQPGPQLAPGPGANRSDKPYALSLGFQVQNLFNHNNPGPIIGNLSSPLFGQANTLAYPARQFDFNVRFAF
jgi:hypothetical protein